MRLRAGSSLLYPLLVFFTVGTGLLVSTGCGGGGSHDPRSSGSASASPSPTPTATATPVPAQSLTVKSVIIWGARSRQTTTNNAVSGLSSALSAVLVLQSPGDGTQVLSQVLNRDVQEGRQQYTSPTQVPSGVYNLVVRFYSGRDGQGQVVGTAGASTSLVADITTADPNDGTLSTTIATFGTIQSVTIPAGQSVTIGQTKSADLSTVSDKTGILVYEPKDAQGNLIAVTPGSAFLTVTDATSTVSGQPSVRASGDTLTGLAPQRALITIKVDDAISPATEIAVSSGITPGGTFTVTSSRNPISILQTANLTATITNDGPAGAQGVTYSLLDNADGSKGSITQTGVFTSTRYEGTVVVRATSVYDPRVFVDTPITVTSQVTVTLTPTSPAPVSFRGGTLKFTASVINVPDGQDQGVTYSVVEQNGGTITPDGLYTAPATPGTYTVRATSNFDTRKVAEVKVPVQSLAVLTVTPNPVASAISIRSNLQFSATVANLPPGADAGVNWSVKEGAAGGAIDATGLYTAPATEGTYTVIATSRFDPTKTVQIAVPVRSFAVVAITPKATTINIKDRLQLTATVTGLPAGGDSRVTYSIAGAAGTPAGTNIGSIDPVTGVYASPSNPVDVVVTAASLFDPKKIDTATISVRSTSTVTFSPAGPLNLSIRATQNFTVTVNNLPAATPDAERGVDFSIVDAAGNVTTAGGTLSAAGPTTVTYTAGTTTGTFFVRAQSRFDPTVSSRVQINLASAATFNPTTIPNQTISINGRRTFTVAVNPGLAGGSTAVTWSLRPGAGTQTAASTIDPTTGAFVAGPNPENVIVTATSVFDPNKSLSFTVRVASGGANVGIK